MPNAGNTISPVQQSAQAQKQEMEQQKHFTGVANNLY